MAKRTSKTVRRSKTSVKTKTRNISGPFGSSVPLLLTGGLTALGLLGAIYAGTTASVAALPMQAKYCMIAWLAVSVLATVFITPRNFIVGFLLGLFAMLIGWRIAGLHNIAIVIYPLLAAFIAFVVQFFDCLLRDRRLGDKAHLGAADWHLTLLRILIGFSMVPHFTEKLFAGPGFFNASVKTFAGFGLSPPDMYVLLAGLCEFGIAVGIGMGLLTRLAAVCAAAYFMIATIIGGHFGLGFIWASAGGGWEYPVLMMVLLLSYAVRGAGRFSLDGALSAARRFPVMLRKLSFQK